MDFAALPPEINSGRMYTGAGPSSMLTAAAAWDGLGTELSSAASSYGSVVSGLIDGLWRGPTSAAMWAAAMPYVAWMSTTAERAKQAANQARAAVAAYETAFASTVPPALIAENRALLVSLVATNIFGQNTSAIAAVETRYAEMWAQDATAMYGYASQSAAASVLAIFTAPPANTNPAGVSAQAAAVGQAAGASAAAFSPIVLSQLISSVPTMLQDLAAGSTQLANMLSTFLAPHTLGSIFYSLADFADAASGGLFITSGLIYLVNSSANGALSGAMVGSAAPAGLGVGAAGLGGAGPSAGLDRTGVLVGTGRATSIGGLSVPQTWATAAPAIARAATGLPQPTLVGLVEPEVDRFGPGSGGMLAGSLMAAAAGGGGAAAGGWAAQRGGGATQPGSTTGIRYGPQPMVIPPAAREAGSHGQATRPDESTRSGRDSPLNETIRDEINDLRKQLSELATERDVLMRSLALFAREMKGP